MLTALAALTCLVRPVAAQEAASTPGPPQPLRYEEHVEVVGLTPIHGIGVPKHMVPANVQVFTERDLASSFALDTPSLLADLGASVQTSEAQAGTFQPDLVFRGFVASPLIGTSEGLAVYQDGVRVNDPFGDTVAWDTLPTTAIASINLMPGSNPLFGLNALGGALSIRTKDGFGFPGERVSVTTGAFGRHRLEAESGGRGEAVGYYVAGSLLHEAGWRAHSPSTIRRVFGDIAWRGSASALNVSLTIVSNDLTGNGAAPVALLDLDRRAVFTHPDTTGNDLALLTAKGRRDLSATSVLEGVVYFRAGTLNAFNGDAADDDDADEEGAGDAFDGVNNISRTRGRSGGATVQLTRTHAWAGRENHFIAGLSVDLASTRFSSAAELARLTPERGTTRTGIFDDEAFVDLRARTVTGGAFASNTWSVTPALTLTGSARFNLTASRLRDQLGTALTGDHTFDSLNAAGGLTYQLRPWLNVYGGYGQSSRVPSPVELTCADPEDPCRLPNAFVSDPPLDAIVARTWEGGARGGHGPFEWTWAAFTTAAVDDIIFVSSGTQRGEGHFENVDRTSRWGVETSVEYRAIDRVSMAVAHTFVRATYGTDLRIASRAHPAASGGEIAVRRGDRIPGIPAHSGRVAVSARLTDRLQAAVTVLGQSALAFRGDEANLLPDVPGFVRLNAQARHRMTTHVTAVAHVHNLLDARVQTFGVLGDGSLIGAGADPRFYSPGEPRGAWAGLELRF